MVFVLRLLLKIIFQPSGRPQTSQSEPLWLFSKVQCGHVLTVGLISELEADPEPPLSLSWASIAAIWSRISWGSSSISVSKTCVAFDLEDGPLAIVEKH